MNILRTITPRRGATILSVLVLGLALHGCFTEERELNGSVPITLEASFTTQGSTEASASSGSLSSGDVDAIFDALDDADTEAIERAIAAGEEVLIAGLRAVVVENRGHDAARVANLQIDTGSGLRTAAELRVPGNATGTEASAANGQIVVTDDFSGFVELRDELQAFLEAYLAGDRNAAEAILLDVAWRAEWTSTTPPPSTTSPDDFDWAAEIVIFVPAQYSIDVPSF